jgi:hypothetical protein
VRRKLPTRLPANDIDHVGMATLKGMRDGLKRDRITFEGNKDADYSFSKIKSFIWLSENAMPYCLCHREACTGTHIFPRRVCYIQLHYRQKRGQVAPQYLESEDTAKIYLEPTLAQASPQERNDCMLRVLKVVTGCLYWRSIRICSCACS